MMGTIPGNTESDLFRKQMADVTRHHAEVTVPARPRPAPVPRQTRADERAVLDELAVEIGGQVDIETGDELWFHQPGIQRRILTRMRRGRYAISGELDLHGHTVQQAHQRLGEFLAQLDRRRQTCVRIIHGKGRGSPGRQPVLRNKVALWLARRRDVLAYCSAPAHDGGLGALYVLLKNR